MSRRYGEGGVYRKGTGWEASAYVNGRRRSARGRSMREARDKLRTMQERATAGEPMLDERLTVAEYLEYWLSGTESTVRSSTHVRYGQYVRKHALPSQTRSGVRVALNPMDSTEPGGGRAL